MTIMWLKTTLTVIVLLAVAACIVEPPEQVPVTTPDAFPLIIGQTGGECDFGYTSVRFADRLRDDIHYGSSLGHYADILIFNADLNLERTLTCSEDTGESSVEYTLQIRTEAELKHWDDVKVYTPITAPKDSTPIPDPTAPIVKKCKVFRESESTSLIDGSTRILYDEEWVPCDNLRTSCYSGVEGLIYDGEYRLVILDGYVGCESYFGAEPPISDGAVCPSNREYEYTRPDGTKEIRVAADPVPCP